MSWELASAAVLAVALAGGFGWYERSRPQAKVLALVSSLAALAVVGRIAFAALPNVKPTTDIVLFAGFALGGAPGFAVGATAALVSNLFFGQGPWTPWQMAAWGLVGIGGAVLARLVRGRVPGRLPLAAICALAGLAFGAVMDLYQWTLAAQQDLPSYLAISGTSLGYNLAHAVGNAVFALLLGPAFVRALRRYRRRFEVTWSVPGGASAAAGVLVALLLAGTAFLPAPAGASSGATAQKRAIAYVERAQNDDGGFGGVPGGASSQLYTGWAGLGLAGGSVNPDDVRHGKKTTLDYVARNIRDLNDAGELERTILLVHAAGKNPRKFGRRDLVQELLGKRRPNGSIANLVNQTAFQVLALRAGGVGPRSGLVRTAARWIERQQNADGGFGFGEKGGASDVDDTGAVLQALAAARLGRGSFPKALRYLARAQNADGGFGQMRARPSNAQSTAWAVQGLVAAGRNPDRFERGRRTPLAYLRSLQAGNGMIRYSRTSSQTPVWVTAQALMALARKPLPIAPVRHRGDVVVAKKATASGGSGSKPSTAKAAKHSGKAVVVGKVGPAAKAGATLKRPAGPAPSAPVSAAQSGSPAPVAAQRVRAAAGGDDPSAAAIGGAALGAAALAVAGWLGVRRRSRRAGA